MFQLLNKHKNNQLTSLKDQLNYTLVHIPMGLREIFIKINQYINIPIINRHNQS